VHPEGSGSYAEGPVFWEICVGAAEVRIDPDTGVVRVERTATCADVGRAINPRFVERQDEGATLQGLGSGLCKELIFVAGALVNDTMLDYRVPTFEDVPESMRCVIVEERRRAGPSGAKGCGGGAWRPRWPRSPRPSPTRGSRCGSSRSRPSGCGAAVQSPNGQGGWWR
jgi:CO/xanthine dehydrogenase Mo-binding subunit